VNDDERVNPSVALSLNRSADGLLLKRLNPKTKTKRLQKVPPASASAPGAGGDDNRSFWNSHESAVFRN
jgi:hypothetical protein